MWLTNTCPECGCLLPFEKRDTVPNRTHQVACMTSGCHWSGEALFVVTLEWFLAGREYGLNTTVSVK